MAEEISQAFLGKISIVSFSKALRGFAQCSGQLLPIIEHNSLYSLLGTTYGGNGEETFALPDLRGRVPVGAGHLYGGHQSPPSDGPPEYPLPIDTGYPSGYSSGYESVALTISTMPAHSHKIACDQSQGTNLLPKENRYFASVKSSTEYAEDAPYIYGSPRSLVSLSNSSVGTEGQNLRHDNVQPSIALNFVISLTGIYPKRS